MGVLGLLGQVAQTPIGRLAGLLGGSGLPTTTGPTGPSTIGMEDWNHGAGPLQNLPNPRLGAGVNPQDAYQPLPRTPAAGNMTAEQAMQPMVQGGNPLAQGIVQTAQSLGMNPLDLATIISYETGGTFDPTRAGPTTQWGQHRGLIQFGEPQAHQYGVNWDDPVGSQLGPNGAVARYFLDNGWQPGMSLLDAYSIVNAGGPGRYNASDANNGGAPGTVADKVNDQMGGHRQNAMRLLEGMVDPSIAGAFGASTGGGMARSSSTSQGLLSMPEQAPRRPSLWDHVPGLADPDRRSRMIIALQGMTMNPNEGLINMAQGDLDASRQSAEQQRMMAWLAQQPGGEQFAAMMGAGFDANGVASAYLQSQAPKAPVIEGGMVFDPATGEMIHDYRQPDAGAETWQTLSPENAAMLGLPEGGVYQQSSAGQIRTASDAPRPGQTPHFRPATAEEAAAYGARAGKINEQTGEFTPINPPRGMAIKVNPDGTVTMVEGENAGDAILTEGQSKDVGYATRARGALETLETVGADVLASRGNAVAGAVPFGLGREFQDPDYQLADQASREFLAALLRKDSGGAITQEEMAFYGGIYLPQPGEGPEVIEQKRAARERAVQAIEAGMPPAAIAAQERALGQPGQPQAPADAAPAPAVSEAPAAPATNAPDPQQAIAQVPLMTWQQLNDLLASYGGVANVPPEVRAAVTARAAQIQQGS